MRSNLTEPRPASRVDPYRAWSAPGFQSPAPPPPVASSPQRQAMLAPSEGWLPLLLLAIAVYSVVYSVTLAITIHHTEVLWITTAIGLLCGLATAKIRSFSQTVLHFGACLVGFWLALLLTSFLAYQTSPFIMLASLHALINGGFQTASALNSEMIFLLYLAFLCFFLGYFGSWLIYRAHLPWLVALVYVSIMLVNLNYVTTRDLSFMIVLLVSPLILLIARTHLASQITQWKNDGLYTDQSWVQGIATRFLRITALFMLLILPFSWFLPMLNQPSSGVTFWNDLDNAWANLSHGNFSALSDPNSLFSPYQPPVAFFGDQLTITGNVKLPAGPVLSYTYPSSTQGQYLESFTFDQFDGHTWTSQLAKYEQSFDANADLPQAVPNAHSNPQQTSITIIQPPGGTKSYIFAPLEPASFTVPITLLSDSTNTFISAWTQTNPLQSGERYTVTSNVPVASATDLANIPLPKYDPALWKADGNYPALLQNYVQTPKDLSSIVNITAHNWTRDTHNAYEAALDLQAHLHDSTTFTYSLQNPPIPANVDAVTWLLQTRQGYCTYYATAMTIMARLIGLPARVVNGFSQGHYDTQQQAWIVNGSDAHSWVQIYFPNQGWLTFDPTPGFSSPNQIPLGSTPTVSSTPPHASPSPTATAKKPQIAPPPTSVTQPNDAPFFVGGLAAQNILLAFALMFLCCSLIVLGLSIKRYRGSYTPHSPVTSIYARLCRVAGLIGSPPAVWQTPYEYTFALSRRFPEAATTLRRLADLFVRERWATPQHAPAPTEEHDLAHLWPRLRNAMLRAPFKKRS